MKKQLRKKLTLAKETLNQLQAPSELPVGVVGASGMDSCTCRNCTVNCVTYWGPPCGPLYPYG